MRSRRGVHGDPDETPAAPAAVAPILVVDDDPAILAMVSRTLESEGYRPITASNGEAALAAVEAEAPRLIVLDMRMPILDGPSFVSELRARGHRIPVLVMTAAADARRSARDIDADAYVAKPFDLDDLIAAVERTLPDTHQH